MSESQFWNSNPKMLAPFIEADKIKKKELNFNAWLQGRYFHVALNVNISNALKALKGKQGKSDYLDKPIDIFPLTEREIKQREEEELNKFFVTLDQIAKNN